MARELEFLWLGAPGEYGSSSEGYARFIRDNDYVLTDKPRRSQQDALAINEKLKAEEAAVDEAPHHSDGGVNLGGTLKEADLSDPIKKVWQWAMDSMDVPQDPEPEDMVNHPPHYTSHPSGVECISITRHHNFNVGNAIKYLWRQGLKTDQGRSALDKQIEDLEKAVFYLTDEIARLRNEGQ